MPLDILTKSPSIEKLPPAYYKITQCNNKNLYSFSFDEHDLVGLKLPTYEDIRDYLRETEKLANGPK